MALTKEEKELCFTTALKLAYKVAEGGGIEKGIEMANTIEYTYKILVTLTEEKKS